MSVQSDDFSPSEPASGAAPDGQATDDQDTIRAELAELEQKADEYLRLAQRTQADFINYRRRVEEERAQQTREANLAYIQRLLPVLAEFDPREHEGVGRQPSADVPEGHVLQVVRQGYRKGDRVIRPAQVIIAARP